MATIPTMENTWRPTDAPRDRAWMTALASVPAGFVVAALSATYVLTVDVARGDAGVWT